MDWSQGCRPSLFLSLHLDGRRKYNNTPLGEGASPQSQGEDETDGSVHLALCSAPDFRQSEPEQL